VQTREDWISVTSLVVSDRWTGAIAGSSAGNMNFDRDSLRDMHVGNFAARPQASGRVVGPVTGSINNPDQCSGPVVRRLASMSR
jgi:hypothetical protein